MTQQPGFLNLADAVDRLRVALVKNRLAEARDLSLLCAAQARLIAQRLDADGELGHVGTALVVAEGGV